MPTVSVVVPCHNGGQFLPASIGSILEQEITGATLEVVVVDDRSSDPQTVKELGKWAAHPLVRVMPSEGAPGPSGARNTGLRHSEGEWVAFLDDDDLWLPQSLQHRLDVLKTYPDATFISADFIRLVGGTRESEHGFFRTRPLTRELLKPALQSGRPQRLERPVELFLQAILTWTGVAMARREVLLDTGGFDESLRKAEDDHLWIRLARREDMVFTPHVVALYRQRSGSLTDAREPPRPWSIIAYEKLLADPDFRPHRKAIRNRLSGFALENTYYHRREGERKKAIEQAGLAIARAPGTLRTWTALVGSLLGRP